MTEWYKQKEKSAGVKRLLLSWWMYKHFGVFPLRFIAFFVTFFAYFGLAEQKCALNDYFDVLKSFTGNKKFTPSLFNRFRVFLNYANSLVDKIQGFAGDYKNIGFENEADRAETTNLLKNKQGIFFIINHVGNVELMRVLFNLEVWEVYPKVNVFLQKNHCEVFNAFLAKIAVKTNVEVLAVEDINVNTAVEIEEKLANGEIVFMAGDRLSAQNSDTFYQAELLGKKVKLPIGVLRFAQMLDAHIYFVSCAKENGFYKINTKSFTKAKTKIETIQNLQKEYVSFLQSCILKYPYQYYQFFKFFE